MDLRYLESFVSVAEHGSFVESARRLNLTPAAIAARIHALERQLGTQLIQRSGRAVRPTEAGLKILDRARAVLRDTRDLEAIARDGAMLGELRLGVFMSATLGVLPQVLGRLYATKPELVVFVVPGTSADLCQKVASGALDAAIVVEPQSTLPVNCDFTASVEEKLVLVAPARMAGRDAHELLRSEHFIRYDRTVVGGQLADRYLRDQNLRPRQRLELDGMMAVAGLVAQDLGVSLLPDWAPLWKAGLPIVRIPLPGKAPIRRVGLVWDDHGPRAPLARIVMAATNAAWKEMLTIPTES